MRREVLTFRLARKESAGVRPVTGERGAMAKAEARFIVGLPGSGKTPYLRRLQTEGWVIFDDYQANADGNSPRFRAGRLYDELVKALRDGKRCAVADMKFCRPQDREEASNNLEEDVPASSFAGSFSRTTPSDAPKTFAKVRGLQSQDSRSWKSSPGSTRRQTGQPSCPSLGMNREQKGGPKTHLRTAQCGCSKGAHCNACGHYRK